MCGIAGYVGGFIPGLMSRMNQLQLHRGPDGHGVVSSDANAQVKPAFFGTQAQRRRWLRKRFMKLPGFSIAVFLHTYIIHGGFLDGRPVLVYATFRFIQFCHIKAKTYELEQNWRSRESGVSENSISVPR